MSAEEIIHNRLFNQQLLETKFTKPEEIIGWFAAMQAQEFAMVKWAISLRLPGSIEKDIDNAFNKGKILRTHLLRPTWHFVSPKDIRWMLMLTGPRVHTANGTMYRKLELDQSVLKRCHKVITKVLEGKRHLTREELKTHLEKNKITAEGLRLGYIMMHAELEGLICSGPRKEKQFTYALLDERVPATKPWHREDALAELAMRYFSSRGPASAIDFSYWSGLTLKDAKAGMEMVKHKFTEQVINGQKNLLPEIEQRKINYQRTFLMPQYDEYGASYKKWEALINAQFTATSTLEGKAVYNHLIIIDGKAGGMWQRIAKNKELIVNTEIYRSTKKGKTQAVKDAVNEYKKFFQSNDVLK
jgi:hypothetical protein